MPTQTVWIDPERLLKHHGVQVFQTYKDDDYDQGARRYTFTLDPQCGEGGSRCEDQPCQHLFDVRELSTWRPPQQPPFCTGANDTPENHAAWNQYFQREQKAIRTAIAAAIELAELTPSACLPPAQENKANPASAPENESPTSPE
ncbi:MAG: hypothetical protein HYY23_00680 [Verrucomicrobia bacterium]|nr:hypothetical protein [Verrucomicrobiota bacterium]